MGQIIQSGQQVTFEGKVWRLISPDAKNFILMCLNRDKETRCQIKDLFETQWIRRWIENPVIEEKTALNITDSLVSFRKLGLLQSGMMSFMTNLMATSEELDELADMFK